MLTIIKIIQFHFILDVNSLKSRTTKDYDMVLINDQKNDAPSLALAYVRVAIGAKTQVAMDSADVVLTHCGEV